MAMQNGALLRSARLRSRSSAAISARRLSARVSSSRLARRCTCVQRVGEPAPALGEALARFVRGHAHQQAAAEDQREVEPGQEHSTPLPRARAEAAADQVEHDAGAEHADRPAPRRRSRSVSQSMPKANTVNRLARNGNASCGAATATPSCSTIATRISGVGEVRVAKAQVPALRVGEPGDRADQRGRGAVGERDVRRRCASGGEAGRGTRVHAVARRGRVDPADALPPRARRRRWPRAARGRAFLRLRASPRAAGTQPGSL